MNKLLIFFIFSIVSVSGYAADDAPTNLESEPESEADPEQTESTEPAKESGPKTMSGMSILGNEEAPKSLVIVPWKSSEMGDGISLDDSLAERAQPVDKEVFMRELEYFEIRSGD